MEKESIMSYLKLISGPSSFLFLMFTSILVKQMDAIETEPAL